MSNASALASLFLSHLPDLTTTPTGHLRHPKHKFTKDSVLLAELLRAIPEADRAKALELAGGVAAVANPDAGADIRAAIRGALNAKPEEDDRPDYSQILLSTETPIPLSELRYVYNFGGFRRSVLYWPEKDRLLEWEHEALTNWLKIILGKHYGDWVSSHAYNCERVYEPNQPRKLPPIEKDGPPRFNAWAPADWAKDWTPPSEKAECPKEVAAYLEAISGGDRETVKGLSKWLRDATFTRAKSVLVLAGAPGCGKNVFVEHLAAALVGRLNFNKAASGFKNKDQRFQASITGCRLFFLDEVYLDDSARDTLKVYHNAEATFERKGVEVGRMEKIHASIVVANNYLNKVKLEYSDRKFYVPVLAKASLDATLGVEAKDRLLDVLLKDDAYVRRIADWLYTNFKDGASARFPKTGLFKTLCINSYPPQFRVFIDLCRRAKKVYSKTVNKRSRTPYSVQDLEALIEHYEINFGEKLATIGPGSIGLDWDVESHIFEEAAGDAAADAPL